MASLTAPHGAPAPQRSAALTSGLSFTPNFGVVNTNPLTYGIAPAEKVVFSWRLRLYFVPSPKSVGSSVVATLLLDGNVIWTSPPVPVTTWVIYVVPPPDALNQDTGLQQETISFAMDSPAAQSLYAFGNHTLSLQVLGNGPSPGPFTSEINLLTGPGAFFGSWWNWNPAPMPAWKSAYGLGGVFSNFGECPFSIVRATLTENDVTDNTVTMMQTLDLGPVASGSNTGQEAFTPITQSWQWFDPVTFLQTASFSKSFNYTVALTAQDPWGNEYQATSPGQLVNVTVPSGKQTDEGLAVSSASMAATLLAAAAAAASFPGGWTAAGYLLAAAGAAYSTAQVLGVAAGDPPEPDPAYQHAVRTKAVHISPKLSGTEAANALAALFRLVLEVGADHEALSIVENRMLGALKASDRKALDMQVARHTELTSHMRLLGLQLPSATGAAIEAIQANPPIDPVAVLKILSQWKQTGIPQDAKKAWIADGLHEGTLSAIETVIREMPLGKLAVPIPQHLAAISLGMTNWANDANLHAPELR